MEVLSVFGTSQHNSLNLSHKRNDDWIGGIFYTKCFHLRTNQIQWHKMNVFKAFISVSIDFSQTNRFSTATMAQRNRKRKTLQTNVWNSRERQVDRLKILRSGRNCICSLAGTQKIPHTSKDATTWRCSRLAKISNESWSSWILARARNILARMQTVIRKAAGLKVTTGRRTWGTDDKYQSEGSVRSLQGCNSWGEMLISKNQLGASTEYQGGRTCWLAEITWGELQTTKDATGGRSCWLARNSWGDLLTSKDTTGGRSCWLARISWENPRMQHVGGAVD